MDLGSRRFSCLVHFNLIFSAARQLEPWRARKATPCAEVAASRTIAAAANMSAIAFFLERLLASMLPEPQSAVERWGVQIAPARWDHFACCPTAAGRVAFMRALCSDKCSHFLIPPGVPCFHINDMKRGRATSQNVAVAAAVALHCVAVVVAAVEASRVCFRRIWMDA